MMYPWLWRHLPGPTWLRVVQCVLLAVAAVVVCFLWVFPAVAPLIPINDITVE